MSDKQKIILVCPNAYPAIYYVKYCQVMGECGVCEFAYYFFHCVSLLYKQYCGTGHVSFHPIFWNPPLPHSNSYLALLFIYMEYSLIVGISFLLVKKLSLNIIHFIIFLIPFEYFIIHVIICMHVLINWQYNLGHLNFLKGATDFVKFITKL